ncbi:hypothetical protein BWP39_23550 [Paraburkholderia acidicola]|uniref:Aspartate/glutamate/uridylate kinase domain-containing protein n=1 Tax=Paraburkholderia acidicola TaxID=1912599 RepID=A0A2A4EQH3_9BURK|nr:hypothetical protein [Paraburkholderia acidicola]PCE22658.1 hypothetical protein BWP39_23550 [Paraburkholderia acidicola]
MSNKAQEAPSIVIKLGSSTLTSGGHPNRAVIAALCDELKQLRERGQYPIVVTSGAVQLGVPVRRTDCCVSATREGFAAVGQIRLMSAFADCLSSHSYSLAQILLKHEDFLCQHTRAQLIGTITSLSCSDAIVLINENDVTSGGRGFPSNDELSAALAALLNVSKLVIFTDRPGVYEADPRVHPQARLFETIGAWDEQLLAAASDIPTATGTGGMKSKILAAQIAAEHGAVTVITNYAPRKLQRIVDGERLGTWIMPETAVDRTPTIINA